MTTIQARVRHQACLSRISVDISPLRKIMRLTNMLEFTSTALGQLLVDIVGQRRKIWIGV